MFGESAVEEELKAFDKRYDEVMSNIDKEVRAYEKEAEDYLKDF